MIKPILLVVAIYLLFARSFKYFTEWTNAEVFGYGYMMLGFIVTMLYFYFFNNALHYTVLLPLLLGLIVGGTVVDKIVEYVKSKNIYW